MAEYDYTTLSPADFELLVRDLLSADRGWKLEAFGAGRDGGVDLRATDPAGTIVVQCKHYAQSTFSQLKAAVKSELLKINKLAPARYLLVTSRSLSKTQKDALVDILGPTLKVPTDILHRADLNSLIEKHPDVERNHFKLWLASAGILSSIVHSGIWARSEALLEDIQSRVRMYVTNPTYSTASDALAKVHVLVITGAPGVGKSMLAEMLLLTHWQKGWQVIQVGANIVDAWDAWSPSDKQIFLYDDFLGQTNLAERLEKNEDRSIVQFGDRVRAHANKRFVLTTRTQVLRQAEDKHEPLRRAQFDLTSCVVRVSDYTMPVKARILYNHLYFSGLPRTAVKWYISSGDYWIAIRHRNYNPRVIEQVLLREYATGRDFSDALLHALENPVDLWGPSFENGLSDLSQDILLRLATFPVLGIPVKKLVAPFNKTHKSRHIAQAHKAIEGTWVTERSWHGQRRPSISFADPSCRDFVLHYLDSYPDEIFRVLDSTTTMEQVLLMLSYAASEVEEKPKYPGMRSEFHAHQSRIWRWLDELYPNASTYEEGRARIRALAGLISARAAMSDDIRQWVVDTALVATASRSARSSDADAYDTLVEYLNSLNGESGWQGADQIDTCLKQAAEGYAESVETRDEFELFMSFAEDVNLWALNPAALETAQDSIVNTLDTELSDVRHQFHDPDDMSLEVDEIERLAYRFDLEGRVQSAVDSARERIRDLENFEPDEEDLRPVVEERAFENATPRVTKADLESSQPARTPVEEIDDLFGQLG